MDENILPRDQNHITAAGFESSSTEGLVLPGQIDEDTGRILVDSAGGGGGTPAEPDTSLQFNDGGSFGGAQILYTENMGLPTLTFPSGAITDNGGNLIVIGNDDGDANGAVLEVQSGNGSAGGTVAILGGEWTDGAEGARLDLTGGNEAGEGGPLSMSAGDGDATAGAGGTITVTSGSATSASDVGGDITIQSGDGTGGEGGGNIFINAGNDQDQDGASIELQGGEVGSGEGPTGNLLIKGGNSTAVGLPGGGVIILGGEISTGHVDGPVSIGGGYIELMSSTAPLASDDDGGTIRIITGVGDGTGAGGELIIESGEGGATGAGGLLTITGGAGGATSGDGGELQIVAGSAQDGNGSGGALNLASGDGDATGNGEGGEVVIRVGQSYGSGVGSDFSAYAGSSAGSGNGGNLLWSAGGGGSTGGNGGYVEFDGGSAAGGNGNGGDVVFAAGAKNGAGTPGKFKFLPGGLNFYGILDMNSVATTDKTFTFPNYTGTVGVNQGGRVTAQTAAVASVATYTVGSSDASFRVSGNVNVTTSTAHSFTVTCTYTDETNSARTLTLGFTQLAGATIISSITNVTGAGPYVGLTYGIRCKAATTITFATTGTFTTVTYNAEGRLEQLA